MAELVVAGTAAYPRLPPLISLTYVCSHGISPSPIVVRTQVGATAPPAFGNLAIADGVRALVLTDCKLDYFAAVRQVGQGVEWELRFLDERWKWQYTVIHGWYNQLDPHGKLIPSTVRSPTELATLCLQAMGVARYTVDMPPGISSRDAANIPEFLVSGVNFPPVGINPPCDWFADNAATALAQLCDLCGRRIVFDPVSRSVHVVRAGVGANLPPGSISMQQASITAPDTPDAVAVVGAPTRFQPLLPLQAVGIEWNGQIKPINALSYAPFIPGSKQKVRITVAAVHEAGGTGLRFDVAVRPDEKEKGVAYFVEYTTTAGESTADAAAGLELAATAVLGAAGFGVTRSGSSVYLEIQTAGRKFDVLISPGSSANLMSEITVGPSKGEVSWSYCSPPLFEGVRATRQLNLAQAQRLAQASVFKMYRVTGTDVTTGRAPINVPGYGNVYKRQNIILLDTKVEQIVPDAGDADYIDVNDEVLITNLYDGYSRDQAAVVFGSVSVDIFNSVIYIGDGAAGRNDAATLLSVNTNPDDRVPVSFTVDPTYQTITFSDYVYRTGEAGTNDEPQLVLQTAVHIRDAVTQQLVPYTDLRRIRPGNTIMTVKRPDVQLNVYGEYRFNAKRKVPNWRLTGAKILEADAILRARYYLDGTLFQFQLKPGVVQKYNGIVPVRMDGRVMQVSYSIRTGQGCDTTVSLNGEHDTWVAPYPARRRAENLAAVDRVVPAGARNIMQEGPEFFNAKS